MAKKYSRESGSLFPDSLLVMNSFKDIDDSVKSLVNQYYQFMQNGEIDSAIALKEANPGLDSYWISAGKLNLIKEEIQNIGIYAQKLRNTVISENVPDYDYDEGVSWIEPIEVLP